MNERLERFITLMRQIFELDKSDLDFGIYRIMNIRRKEIDEFLTDRLPKQVRDTLAPFAQGDKADIQAQLAQMEKNAADMGMTIAALPDTAPMKQKYVELQKQLDSGSDMAALEADVYSALYSFFNRYYDEGDFVSKRRYKEGVYAIPYEGEEVKLYWANQDQYYVKTSENFKDYSFVAEGITVHFMLVDATTEQNNNKESEDSKRQFMLYVENEEQPEIKAFEYRPETGEFIIRFVFDVPEDKKAKYLELNSKAIRTKIAAEYPALIAVLLKNVSSDPKKEKTLIDRHLEAYVAKNTFDYFIHKDLKGFLDRELDFYIKNEVMHLDDLDTTNEKRVETWLAKVRAIKRVGHIIIDFLAQIENFQKKLWLKKKFIVETNWCITLDRIEESFWPEIIANAAQMQEWIDMYAIDEVEPQIGVEGWTNPPSMAFLRQNQNLIVDTKHFSSDFKDRLLASFDDLDKQTDSLMINADNYHALSMLDTKYHQKIKSIYIDPPYNAQSSEILYKNSFKHSSWLSLMDNRLREANMLLSEHGVEVIAIDEVEQTNLGELLCNVRPNKNIAAITVIHNPSGQMGDNFAYTHEFAYFIYPNEKNIIGLENRPEEEWDTRTFRDNSGNSNLRTDAKNCFYPIYCRNNNIVGFGDVCPDSFHPGARNISLADGTIAVYPIDNNGVEKKWVFERGTVEGILDELWVKNIVDGIDILRTKKRFRHKTTWTDKKYSANSYGSSLLTAMNVPFSYPKSIYTVQECMNAALSDKNEGLVLDFFAGSGTTGHAALLSNYLDKGHRKFILVEMGNYFEQATKNRICKAIYAVDIKAWKKGKPQARNCGISHLMKYFSLESYEDALSNISLSDEADAFSLFGDDYLIHYMLDVESKGSLLDLEQFKAPFSYKLKINEHNETKTRVIDLVETFNYLIGLSVSRQSKIDWFRAESDASGEYEGAVRLYADLGGDYGFKQVEGILPDGRRALVIWRTITEDVLTSNAALDAYFRKHRINPQDHEFDVIYVNGDNNLENLKADGESWKVCMTEREFQDRMFEEV